MNDETKVKYAAYILLIAYGIQINQQAAIDKGRELIRELNKIKTIMSDQNQLQPHEERVVEEKKQLDEKMSKLFTFFSGAIFVKMDPVDRKLLEAQFSTMEAYSKILGLRISRF